MKRLLTILSTITLTIGGASSVVACSSHNNNADDELGGENQQSHDIKILNDIVNEANRDVLNYLKDSSLIDSTQFGATVMDPLFKLVGPDNHDAVLDLSKPENKQAINAIEVGFKAIFDEVNRKIKQKYSNVYVDSVPLSTNFDKITYNLKYIDQDSLKALDPTVNVDNLKSVNINFDVVFAVKYKKFETQNTLNLQYIVTNSPKTIQQLQQGVITKLSNVIVSTFADNKIVIDKNKDYHDIYNNFDINYSVSHTRLDNIVEAQLRKRIADAADLKDFKDKITWNQNQSILSLLSGAINEDTNGTAIAAPENSSDHWAGAGFQPDQIQPEKFVKFYKEHLLSIFKSDAKEFQLANFNINLAKISLAGMPLSGTFINNGKPLGITINITNEGINQKLLNFGGIITSFMKYFKAESFPTSWTIHLPKDLFEQIKSKNHRDSFALITDYFVKQDQIKDLPDLNLFNFADLVNHVRTWRVRDEHTIDLNKRDVWNVDFMFGNKTVANSIFYTPITSWNFSFDIKDDLK